jgi:hypothetical protein
VTHGNQTEQRPVPCEPQGERSLGRFHAVHSAGRDPYRWPSGSRASGPPLAPASSSATESPEGVMVVATRPGEEILDRAPPVAGRLRLGVRLGRLVPDHGGCSPHRPDRAERRGLRRARRRSQVSWSQQGLSTSRACRSRARPHQRRARPSGVWRCWVRRVAGDALLMLVPGLGLSFAARKSSPTPSSEAPDDVGAAMNPQP